MDLPPAAREGEVKRPVSQDRKDLGTLFSESPGEGSGEGTGGRESPSSQREPFI